VSGSRYCVLNPRELGRNNVERLKGLFQMDNVRQLEPGNHILVGTDQIDLDDAMPPKRQRSWQKHC
jgi:hypothetical protein